MKKITAIMLAAIMLIVCVAVSVSAAQASAVIHSDKVLKATATVDGNLDPAYLQSMKVSINPPKYAGVETNVKATVYALYDNNFVYVFYQVENDTTLLSADDDYIADHPHPSHNDAVELRIGDDLEEKLPEYTGSNAAHHLFIMDAYGKRFSCYEDAMEDYIDLMKGAAKIVSATAYNIEMAIPLVNQFNEGDIIQFNFQVDDCQNAEEQKTGYIGLGDNYMALTDFEIGGAAPGGTISDTPIDTPVDTPVVDDPVVDTPVVDDPVVDTPVVDEPVVDTPVVDEPVVDTPVVDEPVVEDEPVEGEPVEGEPVEGEPVEGEPVEGEPVEGEPVEEEPKEEEPKEEEPKVEEPKVEEPKVEEPKEEKSNTGLIIGIVAAVVVIAAIVVVVLKKKK